MSNQGAKANLTGNILEKFVQQRLLDEGYIFIKNKKIFKNLNISKYFTTQYPIAKGIYDTILRCDVFVYNKKLWNNYLAIECKWQQSAGSVDEKFPYLVLNIKTCFNHPTIIILDGGGYKKGADKWLKHQINNNLLHVFNMMEFTTWCNNGNI